MSGGLGYIKDSFTIFKIYIGWIFQEKEVSQQVTPCFNILGVYFILYKKRYVECSKIEYEGQPGLETTQSMLYTAVLYVQLTLITQTVFFKKMSESIKFIGKLISSSRQSHF